MNRHLHRIVFNAARGMRMVVQETATSTGKGANKATTMVGGALAGAAALAPVLIGAALVGILTTTSAHAQIVGAPNVSPGMRPTVLVAPNGVPLVNIATPSAAGVSRNIYNQFNVAPNGAILNNSRSNVQTQLGGYVQGNPFLATGPARIILNEVNGGSPSQLRGYIEVGGQRAEVIIANPAGISVDGGGFINASRATLTTGTPQFNAIGGLDSFLVRGGTVTIDGAGLDASKTDYAAILARAVQVNAGIWASELKVVTGANQVSADHSQITPTSGTGSAPAFALDVAALGGMYANKISLIGTEAGLGVRNAGNIGAGAGGLVVTAAGRLENIGTLEGQRVELTTPGDIDNRGGTIRQTSTAGLTIASPVLSNTHGGVIGAEPVSAGAGSAGTTSGGTATPGSTAPASGGGTTTPSATDGGSAGTGGTSTPAVYTPPAPGAITAGGTISNDGGRIYAGGPIALNTPQINNAGGLLSVASMAVSGPNFSNAGGTVTASNSFSANVGQLDNSGGKLNAGSLNIVTNGDLINVAGTLASASEANLSVSGKIDNTRGVISGAGALTANVIGATNNSAGTLVANQTLTLNTASLLNTTGSIQSTQAGVQVATNGRLVNGSGGAIGAATSLGVLAGSLDNTGSLRGARDADVSVTGAASNSGSITAGRNATIMANTLASNSTSVLGAGIQSDGSIGTAGDLRVTTTGALVANGQNVAAGNATLQGASVDLSNSKTNAANIAVAATQGGVTTDKATVTTPGALDVRAAGSVSNVQGTLKAGTTVALSSGAILNEAGLIQSGGAMTLDTHGQALTNTNAAGHSSKQGGIASADMLTLTTGDTDNTAGFIGSKNALVASTGKFVNDKDGMVIGQSTVAIDTHSASYDNRNGQTLAVGNLQITAGDIQNAVGLIRSTAATTLNANSVANANTQGKDQGIEGVNVAITAPTIGNQSGAIRADQNLTLAGSTQIDNTSGLASAGDTLAIKDIGTAKTLSVVNINGTFIGGKNVTVDAGSVTWDGKILSLGDMTLAVNQDITFAAGSQTVANNNLNLSTTGDIHNSGRLAAGNNLALSARSIENTATGDIEGKTTTLNASDTVTNRGVIDGKVTRINATTLDNLGTGRIYGDQISIGVDTLNNDTDAATGGTSAGTIAARNRLDLGVTTLNNRNGALIFSDGDLAIGGSLDAAGHATGTAGIVNNHAATIEATNNVSINTRVLNNTNGGVTWTMTAGKARDVVEYALGGSTQRYTPDQVRYVLNYGSRGINDLTTWPSFTTGSAAIPVFPGASSQNQLLIPSSDYPLSRYGAYYGNSPDHSSDLYENRCTSIDFCETVTLPGKYYPASDPIWATFGVVPPPVIPSSHPARLDPNIVVGQDGYNVERTNGHDGQTYIERVPFAHPVTQAEYDQWQSYQQAHKNIDIATRAFVKDVQNHSYDSWNYWGYTEQSHTPVLQTSAPARIIAGGKMDIAVGSGTNDMSQILAGRDLNVTGGKIVNKNVEVAGDVTQTGASGFSQPDGDSRSFVSVPFTLSIPTTVTLAAARQEGNVKVVGSGTGTGTLTPGQTNQGVASASGVHAGGSVVAPIIEVRLPSNGPIGQVVRTTLPSLDVPTASLFRTHTEASSHYLIETDPRFANYRNWLSSDYLLNNLGQDPNNILKRLGDGFYEQRLVREQVAQLTGQRYLDGYDNDDKQYAALMDAGATFARQYGLRPGIALSDAQMAQLTSDIVWLVEQTVTLPDGSTQRVLVPQVYVKVREGDIDGSGALLAGKEVNIKLDGDFVNSGTVAGRKTVNISAENIQNLNGRISGDSVDLRSRVDINNIGGTIDAGSKLSLDAGRDINVRTTTSSATSVNLAPTSLLPGAASMKSATIIDRVAGLYVSNPGGALVASAGRDVNLIGAIVSNSGKDGTVEVGAGRDVNLGTVTIGDQQTALADPRNSRTDVRTQEIGTRIESQGDISLHASRDVNVRAGTVNSADGALDVYARRDINIVEGQSTAGLGEMRFHSESSGFGSESTLSQGTAAGTKVIGSSLGGKTVILDAGRDILVRGSNVVSDTGTELWAGNNVTIEAATQSQASKFAREDHSSGVFDSNMGLTWGRQDQTGSRNSAQSTAVGSTVGAISGDVTITAGNRYRQVGSDVTAPGGNIDIQARDIQIVEARESSRTDTRESFSQSGISLGVKSPFLSLVQSTEDTMQAMGDTKDSRMNALGAASIGLSGYSAYQDIAKAAAGQGNGGVTGMGATLTIGSSSSETTSTQSSDTAAGSRLQAGGNVTLTATGGGKDSNILVRGSTIDAGKNVNLSADNNVTLEAAANSNSQSSTSRSSNGSIGVGMSFGETTGITLEVAAGSQRGSDSGTDGKWTPTTVTAGNQLTIKSGGDTTLRGASASGERVVADVGGNLRVETLQDTSTYRSQSSGSGFSGSFCIYMCYGGSVSVNANNMRGEGNYASANQQSGLFAGDGGFGVKVGGNTTLVGGVIASTDAAVSNGRNSFSSDSLTMVDLVNHDVFRGSGYSVSVSTSWSSTGSSPGGSAGIGSKNVNQSSVTQSGISGIAGNTAVRTGVSSTNALRQTDFDRAMRDVGAQVQLTAQFGSQAARAAGSYADQKFREALVNQDAEGQQRWGVGGSYRVALHAGIGALTGGASGAAGAAAASLSITDIGARIYGLGLPDAVAQGLTQAIALAIGGAVGGSTGAGAAFNEASNNNLMLLSNIGGVLARFGQQGWSALSADAQALMAMCARNQGCAALLTTSMMLAINTSQVRAPEPTGAGAIPVGPRDPLPPPDPMVNVPVAVGGGGTTTPGTSLPGQQPPGYETPSPGTGNQIIGTPITPPIAGTVMMSESGNRLVVLDSNRGAIHVRIEGANGPMEVMTDVSQNGDQLVLSGLHVEGTGDNTSSLRELREAAREIGLLYGASEVLVRGGRRANGANPGHWPRDVVIRMK